MKMKMIQDEVIKLATEYIMQQVGPNPQLLGESCEYRLLGARRFSKDEWSVSFQIHFPGPPASIVDGPVLVVVDPTARKVDFFEEWFRKSKMAEVPE